MQDTPAMQAQTNTNTMTITTTNTTTIATIANIVTPHNSSQVVIKGVLLITPGTGCTAVQVQIVRQTPAGNVNVSNYVISVIAAQVGIPLILPFAGTDIPGEVDNQTYVVAVTQTGATGNGTVTFSSVTAEVAG